MYVCVCKGITEKQIQDAVEEGTTSLRGLRLQLGVASQCGRCADCACDVIKQAQCKEHPKSNPTFGGASLIAYASPKNTP